VPQAKHCPSASDYLRKSVLTGSGGSRISARQQLGDGEMKRDFELIRMILRDIEEIPPGQGSRGFTYDGYANEAILAHVVLLHEAGLIKATVMHPLSGVPRVSVTGLTWEGHDFLAVANNDTIWEKAKKTVLAPAAGATWAAVLEWLKAESLKAFGLAT
jgi:hypothetical protein